MIFDEYIIEPKRFEKYTLVNRAQSTLTKDQAADDLSELIYLINNRYCGKEYWEKQGIDFNLCYKEISDYVCSADELYVSDFCKKIHLSFNKGIVDNHFSFASPLTGRLGFSKQYSAFFADFVVEKTGDGYKVIKSSDNTVKIGSVVKGVNCYYKTLFPKNKDYFLVGCRSYDTVKSLKLQIDSICRKVLILVDSENVSDDVCVGNRKF